MEDVRELEKEKAEHLREMNRRIAIAKKEKELEDLRNGKDAPLGILDKLRWYFILFFMYITDTYLNKKDNKMC